MYVNMYRGGKSVKKKKSEQDNTGTPKKVNMYRNVGKNKGGVLGGIGYAAGRAGVDFLRVGEGVVDAALAPVDLIRGDLDRFKSRFQDSVVDDLRERLDKSYNPGKGMQVVGDITGGIGQSIGYGLISAIPYAGKPMMFSSIVEQSISSAAEKTGKVGLKEIEYGATMGALEGVLESKLGAGVNAVKGVGSAILKKTGKEVVESAVKAGGKSLGKTVLKEAAKSFAGEFSEEAISEAVDPTIQRLFGIDKNAKTDLGSILYAGVIGGVSGGIIGGGTSVINYKTAVTVGREIQRKGLDTDLIKRAKYTLSGFDIANERAEAMKTEKPTGDVKETKEQKKQRISVNKEAKYISKQSAELASKIQENVSVYEKLRADPRKANSDAAAAALGELRGNLFMAARGFEVDTVEAFLKETPDTERKLYVDAINEQLEAEGKAERYSLADFDADKDDIRRGYAGKLTLEELMKGAEQRQATRREAGAQQSEQESGAATIAEAIQNAQAPASSATTAQNVGQAVAQNMAQPAAQAAQAPAATTMAANAQGAMRTAGTAMAQNAANTAGVNAAGVDEALAQMSNAAQGKSVAQNPMAGAVQNTATPAAVGVHNQQATAANRAMVNNVSANQAQATGNAAQAAASPAMQTAGAVNTRATNVAQNTVQASREAAGEATDPWAGMSEGTDPRALGARNEAEVALIRAAINWGVPRNSVPDMLTQYRKGTRLSPAEFAEAWSDGAHTYGRFGFDTKGTEKTAFGRMEPEAREAAMKYGRETAEAETKAREEAAKAKKKPAPAAEAEGEAKAEAKEKAKGRVVRGKGVNVRSLSDAQYTGYKAAEVMAEKLGTDIVIEASIEDTAGRATYGYYDRKTNTIHININALRDGKHVALYTLGHEVTHYIKEWSPAKFKVLSDFVMDRMSGDAKDLIDAKFNLLRGMEEYKDYTVAELNELAAEEVVADGMELILTDGKVLEELAREDKTLWEKIRDWVMEIIGQIRRSFESLSGASKTAKVLAETMESLDEIERLFTEGVKEAGERTRTAEYGVEIDEATGTALFSVQDAPKNEAEVNAAVDRLIKSLGVSEERARHWVENEMSLSALILREDMFEYAHKKADRRLTAIVKNSDYKQGTLDFSNICRKRRQYTKMMDRLQRAFPNRLFTAEDFALIRDILMDEDIEVACGLCYVEDRRQNEGYIATNFREAVQSWRAGNKTTFRDSKSETDVAYSKGAAKAMDMLGNDTYVPTIADLTTVDGMEELGKAHPDVLRAWKAFNNSRGMQSSRLVTAEAEYQRQILKYNKARVKTINDLGGLRIFSFSDFEEFHLIDIIQAVQDCAAMGIKIQFYTKVPSFAYLMKDTGAKGNMSLIPKGKLGYHMEGSRVVLDYDNVEGIDTSNEYFKMLSRDNPNIGTVLVGINETQIKAAMADSFIDYIIPFHSGQSGIVRQIKKIDAWENYKDVQTEKWLTKAEEGDKRGSPGVNIYTDVLQAAEKEGRPITNERQFVEKFLQVCAEKGVKPRFWEFLNTDADGKHVYTKGYYKLLLDFKMFDKNGQILPQEVVVPEFDSELLTELTEKYVEAERVEDTKNTEAFNRAFDQILDRVINRNDPIYRTIKQPKLAPAVPNIKGVEAVKRADKVFSLGEAENGDVRENEAEAEPTDREMLLAMAEKLVGSEEENKIVSNYKAGYDTIREKQDRIDELTDRQRELQSIMFTGTDAKARSDAAKELRSIHEEMNTLLEDVADADRKLTEIEGMKAIRNLIQRERLAVRDTYQTKYKTMYERKTEAKATTEVRRSVRRLYNRVNRLLFSPTKTRNVPIGMQSIVAGALRAANVDAEAIERLGQLEEQLAKLEQEPVQDLEKMADLEQRIEAQEQKVGKIKDQVSMLIEIFEATNDTNADGETRLVFDETVLQKLKDLRTEIGNASIRNMDRKQLQALKDFYDMIWHRIKVANNTLASNRKLEINKVGEQSSREVRDSKALKILSPKSMELVGAQTARKYIWSQLKPLTAFEVLGSDTFMSLFREVLNGEDVWARDLEEAFDFIQESKKKHKYDDWDMIKRQTVETAQGSVDLSLSEIMSLYAYSFREQAKSHLMGGGFVLDPNATARVKGKKLTFVELERRLNNPTRYTLTEKQITELGSYLTDDQRAYVEEVQGYLTGMGEKGNQVSRKLYGIDIFREKHYFPIKVKSEYLESQLGKTGDPKIKNRGMTKEIVPEAKNPLVLQDFMAVAGDHINSMATYHAFVLPVEDLTRVLNFKPTNVKLDAEGNPVLDENGMPVADENANVRYDTLKSEIEAKYGAEAVNYIEQLLRDLNGGARRDAAATLMDQGLTAFKRAATMMSLSTIIQQPTSVFRAMAYVDPRWFNGAKKYDYEIVKRYAPVAVMKEIGGFDTGTGMRTTEYLNKKEYKNFNEKLKAAILPESKGGDPAYRAELFGWLTGKADEITWSYLFGACVNEQAAKLKKPADSEAVLKAAGERFADVVRRTQVYDSTLTRNQMMRSKDTGAKLLTQFGAEPATVVSMIVDGLVRSERGDKTFFRKTAAPIAASIIINAMVSSLIYALRDDDEEKNLLEKYLTSLTGEIIEGFNPLEYLPIFRDIMSLFKGYDVERSDMTLIGNLFDQIELITSSNRSVPDKLFGVSGAVASFFCVPITNVYRDVKGIVKTALSFGDAEPMTGGGTAAAAGEGVRGQFNLLYKVLGVQEGNAYELYKAALRGDTAHYDRVAARYETASDAEQALRKELRENDKRINQAAQAKLDGDLDVYESIIEKIEGEGHFDRNLIIRAINNEVMFIQDAAKQATATKEEIEEEEEIDEALYSATDLADALERGDTEDYESIYEYLIAYKTEQGQTEAQARAAIKSSMTAKYKKLYLEAWKRNDSKEMKRILALLQKTGLYGTGNDTAKTVEKWVRDANK